MPVYRVQPGDTRLCMKSGVSSARLYGYGTWQTQATQRSTR